jgi:hypothetical protein
MSKPFITSFNALRLIETNPGLAMDLRRDLLALVESVGATVFGLATVRTESDEVEISGVTRRPLIASTRVDTTHFRTLMGDRLVRNRETKRVYSDKLFHVNCGKLEYGVEGSRAHIPVEMFKSFELIAKSVWGAESSSSVIFCHKTLKIITREELEAGADTSSATLVPVEEVNTLLSGGKIVEALKGFKHLERNVYMGPCRYGVFNENTGWTYSKSTLCHGSAGRYIFDKSASVFGYDLLYQESLFLSKFKGRARNIDVVLSEYHEYMTFLVTKSIFADVFLCKDPALTTKGLNVIGMSTTASKNLFMAACMAARRPVASTSLPKTFVTLIKKGVEPDIAFMLCQGLRVEGARISFSQETDSSLFNKRHGLLNIFTALLKKYPAEEGRSKSFLHKDLSYSIWSGLFNLNTNAGVSISSWMDLVCKKAGTNPSIVQYSLSDFVKNIKAISALFPQKGPK